MDVAGNSFLVTGDWVAAERDFEVNETLLVGGDGEYVLIDTSGLYVRRAVIGGGLAYERLDDVLTDAATERCLNGG
jgi:hypothetical protein